MAIGDVTGPVTDIWWADDERYFVVVSTPDAALGRAVRTLYECTVTAMACQTRLEDESGTLAVPSS